jgi:hypothetical protein
MSALAVPDDVRKYLGKAMRGELEMRFRGLGDSANLMYALGHQMIYALFAITSGAFGYLFFTAGALLPAYIAGGAGGFFALCMVGSMFFARKYRRRA